jgi:hypothetical protein
MKIKVSNGNSKIGKDTFILNITSATDCPTKKLGLCKIPKQCYALQPELRWTNKHHGNILCSRRLQTKIFDSLTPKEIAKQIIQKAKNKIKYQIKYLRIHESGDFRNQKDVNKISRIADYLAKEDIRVYGYAARSDLKYSNLSKNLVLNGSYFMIHNQFFPVMNYSKEAIKCIGNCRICNLCKEAKGLTIENKFHGVAFNKL